MSESFSADDIFQIAERIKENGEHFYSELARRVDDRSAATLFQRLAKDELKHLRLVRKLHAQMVDSPHISVLPGDQAERLKKIADWDVFIWSEIKRYLETSGEPNLADAFALALRLEDEAISLLDRLSPLVPSKEHYAVTILTDQEYRHKEALEKVKKDLGV